MAHSVQGGVLTRRLAAAERHRAPPPSRSATPGTGSATSSAPSRRTRRSSRRSSSCARASRKSSPRRSENAQLRALLDFQKGNVFPKDVQMVTARVVDRSTSAWYSTATINAGSSDGVDVYDAGGQRPGPRRPRHQGHRERVAGACSSLTRRASSTPWSNPAAPKAARRASSAAASPATSRSSTWTRTRRSRWVSTS